MSNTILHKDNFFSIEYDADNKILLAAFTMDYGDIDFEGLKKYLNIIPEVIENLDVKGLLFDLYDAHFSLKEDMYKELFSILTRNFFKNNIILFAYIMPNDYISRVSLELFLSKLILLDKQLLQDLGKDKMFPHVRRGFFEDKDKDKAKSWLINRIKKLNIPE